MVLILAPRDAVCAPLTLQSCENRKRTERNSPPLSKGGQGGSGGAVQRLRFTLVASPRSRGDRGGASRNGDKGARSAPKGAGFDSPGRVSPGYRIEEFPAAPPGRDSK